VKLKSLINIEVFLGFQLFCGNIFIHISNYLNCNWKVIIAVYLVNILVCESSFMVLVKLSF